MQKIEEYLNQELSIIIDHPLGSQGTSFIYPINCGYLKDTKPNLSCYLLGIFNPLTEYTGKCIAIIKGKHASKLIIADKAYSKEAISSLIEFQEKATNYEIITSDINFNSLIPELSVSNIAKSKAFYQKLGFHIVYERPQDKFCFLELENNQIMIEEVNDHWQVGQLTYPFGNGLNISMSLANVQAYYDFITKQQIKIFLPLKVNKYEASGKVYQDSEFLLQDPDGYLLRFNN